MEKTGVLVVSYGSREAAMVDALSRSSNYQVELFIADKQRNPFNVEKATKHVVIPDLNVQAIYKFAQANKDRIDFVTVGLEKPIIDASDTSSKHLWAYLWFVLNRSAPLKLARSNNAYSFKKSP